MQHASVIDSSCFGDHKQTNKTGQQQQIRPRKKISIVVGKILPICIFSIKSIILISKIAKPIWNAFECKYLHIPYELLYMHLKNTINNPSRYLALSIDKVLPNHNESMESVNPNQLLHSLIK